MHRFLTEVIRGRRLRMAPWGFHHLNNWRREEPNLHYFLLGDDTFALMPWMVKCYSRRQLTREERIVNYRISRGRRVVDIAFEKLVRRFRLLLGTMAKAEGCQTHFFTCVVLHNMLRTHQGRPGRAPTPANDVVALQNKQVVYVPDDNYRSPSREVKHQ